jgi:hypothetical protein
MSSVVGCEKPPSEEGGKIQAFGITETVLLVSSVL